VPKPCSRCAEPTLDAEPLLRTEPVVAQFLRKAIGRRSLKPPGGEAPVSKQRLLRSKPPAGGSGYRGHRHATAPMTRAPAPDYVPEAPRHSTGCARRSLLKAKAPPAVIAPRIKPPLNRPAHSPSSKRA
jgi:hypothetical protein